MSIRILIQDAISREDLFILPVTDPYIKRSRIIVLNNLLNEYVKSDDIRAGALQAEMESYIGGDLISASLDPREAGDAFFGLLDPAADGWWDLRSRDPRPGLRVLGAMIERDYFVGLVLKTRKELLTEKDWELAIRECKREWERFAATLLPPNLGASVDDYFSNAYCVD